MNTAVTRLPMIKKHRLLQTSIAMATASLATLAHSQPIDLGSTVISAAGFEQKIIDAPASVSVISRQELESKPYTSLGDALRDVEGIDVGSGFDKNGNISVTLRGLRADYTLVLINGRRQNDVGNIGPNNFGNSQFMYMPPLAAIERIEVVRGPMSTLYGSDAIGGVINIITRKVAKEWGGSLTNSLTLQEDSQYGNDRKTDFYVSGPLLEDRVGIVLRGSLYDREASDPTYSERLPLPAQDVDGNPNAPFWIDTGSFGDKKIVAAQNWNLGTTLSFTPTENHDFTLELDRARQRYDNTQGQSGTLDGVDSLWRASNAGIIQPRVGYTPYQRVERDQVALSHTGRWSFGTLNSSITHMTSSNLGRSLPLTIAERSALQVIWDDNCPTLADCRISNNEFVLPEGVADQLSEQFLPRQRRALDVRSTTYETRLDTQIAAHTLSIGAQLYDAEMEDGVFGMDGGGYREGTVQEHRQLGIFAEDHWGLTDELTLTLGVRHDDHNIFGGNTSPRVYLNWTAAPSWTIKGGVSTGYIAPKPNDLFHGITGFGGQGVSPFVGTPDLQPETSVNYEFAVYFDNQQGASANITLFHNDLQDKIATAEAVANCYNTEGERELNENCVDIGPGWAELGYTSFRQQINIDQAIAQGIEVGSRFAFTPSLMLRANYTFTESEQQGGVQDGWPIIGMPKHMFNATLSWQAAEPLTLSLVSEARSKRFSDNTEVGLPAENWLYYKGYELFHLAARFQVNPSLAFNARINNLLDDDLSGRSCNLNAQQDAYMCNADYNTTEKARSLWLSADVSF